jgi:hypothetical protein
VYFRTGESFLKKKISRRTLVKLASLTGLSAFFGRAYYLKDFSRELSSIGGVTFDNEEYNFVKWIKVREYKLKTRIVNQISKLKTKIKYGKGHNTRMYSELEEYVPLAMNDSSSWIIDNAIPKQRSKNLSNFYIRTEVPNQYLGNINDIEVSGIDSNLTLKTKTIIEQAKPLGAHMMECAGNDRYASYRLVSVADWEGVLLSDLLNKDSAGKSLFGLGAIDSSATHVMVEGFDDSTNTKWNRLFGVKSTPGASWIFSFEELIKQNAFFATSMNGEKLTQDHGFPVRLIVPGYYGCASIKWVNKISFFTPNDNTSTENQMREFSDRTGQVGIPKKFKDHKPPVVELSAVPVTFEKWKSKSGKSRYKITGIIWGGIHEKDPKFNIVLRKASSSKSIVINEKVILGPRNSKSFQHWEYWVDTPLSGRYFVDIECTDKTMAATRLKNHHYRRVLKV